MRPRPSGCVSVAPTAVAVGSGPFAVARQVVRFPGDDDPIVSLLTEVLVAELVSAHWWLAAT